MKFKNLLLTLSLSLAVGQTVFTSSVAYGQEACHAVFQTVDPRTTLVEQLQANKIPAVLAKTYAGEEIPVVLMNAKTGPLMESFLNESIGTQVAHQPNWRNDHGLFRLGSIIADMDTPGARRRGEMHATGISWVKLDSYLQYAGGTNRVEIAYKLSESEMKTATLYGLMRRAAIIRARFTFVNNTPDPTVPNMLVNGGENCFGFCQSSSINTHISEMKNRFAETQLGTADEVLAREDVKIWLGKVRETLLKTNSGDGKVLSATLPMRAGIPESLASSDIFNTMTNTKKVEALNWLVGLDISIPYRDLISDLGFSNSGSGFNGMQNKRATAVLIYDSTVTAENFMSQAYESKGIFSTWTHENTSPLPPAPETAAKKTWWNWIRGT